MAKKIVDILLTSANDNTIFFDLCCGSGAIALELFNRGVSPSNIVMVDIGLFGLFWSYIANNRFSLDVFKKEIDKVPEAEYIQSYFKKISELPGKYRNVISNSAIK